MFHTYARRFADGAGGGGRAGGAPYRGIRGTGFGMMAAQSQRALRSRFMTCVGGRLGDDWFRG